MDKAIYGLAMPFNDSYWEYDFLTNTYTFEKTNRESVTIDRLVGATIGHDYLKELGRTGNNLTIKLHDRGLFFRLIPESPLALSTYKKVKRGLIRHCSVSYVIEERQRDYEAEERAKALSQLIYLCSNIVVKEYKKLLVFEVCIGNHPANKATSCTTDKDHPLLRGVIWDETN